MYSYGCHKDCAPLTTGDTHWDSPLPVAKNCPSVSAATSSQAQFQDEHSCLQWPYAVPGMKRWCSSYLLRVLSLLALLQWHLAVSENATALGFLQGEFLLENTFQSGIYPSSSSPLFSPLITHIDGTIIYRRLLLDLCCMQTLLSFWFKDGLDAWVRLLSVAGHLSSLSLNWNFSKWQ